MASPVRDGASNGLAAGRDLFVWPSPGRTWVRWGPRGRPTWGSAFVRGCMYASWGLCWGLTQSVRLSAAGSFGVVSLWMLLTALLAVVAERAIARTASASVTGEWRGLLHRTGVRGVERVMVTATLVLLVFVTVFARTGPGRLWCAGLLLALFCVFVRAVWQGGISAAWDPDQLVTGRRVRIAVGADATTDRVSVLLRCVLPGPRGRFLPSKLTWETRWQAEAAPSPEGSWGADEPSFVEFDLPDGLPAASPASDAPVHWELVVRAETNWGRVVESFLLPVRAGRS